ncbi:tetratricopeptide repeat protein [Salinispira pacifica]|uniref:TPR domain protein n=1 Tax=Salinispira pacifica TaxID=1307761 RepID=V5WJ15_9SPIO|nr:tetratricopeptide repeat protein [Salinispira pacifica]AHC15161.1 TPR domain protein [Salinispira pacifica]
MAEGKKRAQDILADFLRSHRVALSILTTLIIVGIIALVVGIEVHRNTLDREAERLFELEQIYTEWTEERQEDSRDAGDVLTRVSEFDFRSNSYAAVRKLMILGDIYATVEDFEAAAEQYLSASDAQGYLAATALLKAGLMLENAGNEERAMEVLNRLVDEHDSPEEPRVLFTLGRLSEQGGDQGQALVYYNRLIDEYASSGWTNFAHNRIIDINIANQTDN